MKQECQEGVSPASCPTCGVKLDAATGIVHDFRPVPGDVSICVYCSSILEFDEIGRVRLLDNPEKMAQVLADPMIVKALEVMEKSKTVKKLRARRFS